MTTIAVPLGWMSVCHANNTISTRAAVVLCAHVDETEAAHSTHPEPAEVLQNVLRGTTWVPKPASLKLCMHVNAGFDHLVSHPGYLQQMSADLQASEVDTVNGMREYG